MRRADSALLLPLLVALLVPAVVLPQPGNGGNGGPDTTLATFDTTLVIPAGDTVIVERLAEHHEYIGGDRLHIVARDGVCDINGTRYRPGPQRPDTLLPVCTLRHLYGTVPLVLDYVSRHEGQDSVEVWNHAFHAWYEAQRQLDADLQRMYRELDANGLREPALMDSVVARMQRSPIVEGAQYDSAARKVRYFLRGQRAGWMLRIDGRGPFPSRPPGQKLTRREAADVVGTARIWFARIPRARLLYRNGGMMILH